MLASRARRSPRRHRLPRPFRRSRPPPRWPSPRAPRPPRLLRCPRRPLGPRSRRRRAASGSARAPAGRRPRRESIPALPPAAGPAVGSPSATSLPQAGAARGVTAAAAAPRVGPPPASAPLAILPVDGEEEPRPLNRMRRVIADRLTHSWTSTPHFTVTVAVDVTGLLALRAELKAAGTNLTVTDFVLASTAQTLAEFPDVNSRTDGLSVWPRRRVHLGVAVALPGGLVVPVIRDADRLPIGELHDRTVALATAARGGSLALDDMTGSTVTVANLGMVGVDEFGAIINPGEAAILAVSSAIPTAVAIGDGLAVRTIMKLTLSADHRLVDGEMGARFVGAIRRRLEDPAAFRQEALNA